MSIVQNTNLKSCLFDKYFTSVKTIYFCSVLHSEEQCAQLGMCLQKTKPMSPALTNVSFFLQIDKMSIQASSF